MFWNFGLYIYVVNICWVVNRYVSQLFLCSFFVGTTYLFLSIVLLILLRHFS